MEHQSHVNHWAGLFRIICLRSVARRLRNANLLELVFPLNATIPESDTSWRNGLLVTRFVQAGQSYENVLFTLLSGYRCEPDAVVFFNPQYTSVWIALERHEPDLALLLLAGYGTYALVSMGHLVLQRIVSDHRNPNIRNREAYSQIVEDIGGVAPGYLTPMESPMES